MLNAAFTIHHSFFLNVECCLRECCSLVRPAPHMRGTGRLEMLMTQIRIWLRRVKRRLDFPFKMAISKLKRNRLVNLGFFMKLDMKRSGLTCTRNLPINGLCQYMYPVRVVVIVEGPPGIFFLILFTTFLFTH